MVMMCTICLHNAQVCRPGRMKEAVSCFLLSKLEFLFDGRRSLILEVTKESVCVSYANSKESVSVSFESSLEGRNRRMIKNGWVT